jgi:hypothetical protein
MKKGYFDEGTIFFLNVRLVRQICIFETQFNNIKMSHHSTDSSSTD